MTKYKGKNKIKKVKNTLGWRAKYASEAFKSGGERHVSVTDFNFSERVYYGRIDTDDDPVIPAVNSMRPIVSDAKPGELKYVLPFVVDMFNGFKSKFKQATLLGQIPSEDPYLSDVVVHYAYEDPLQLYSEHVAGIVEGFNNEYLKILDNARQVMTFADYNKHFLRFLKIIGREFPLSLTAFQKSQKSGLYTNGITISIADLDCGDDSLKEEFFLDKGCINFYLNAAKQYGFSVMKNAPWILVADLNSVSTQLYIEKMGLSNIVDIFNKLYIKTYTLDINYINNILINGYNAFINNRKYEKDFSICKNYTSATNIYKETLTSSILEEKYNSTYWLPFYVELRNLEEDNVYTEPEVYRIKQKAISFNKLLDKDRSIRYINEQFRVKHKYAEGGIAHYVKKLKQRSEEK
tara:strand:+ start:1023 stop:2243 length:1221 start_codon:yes stop_codon:yes gene_type:complete